MKKILTLILSLFFIPPVFAGLYDKEEPLNNTTNRKSTIISTVAELKRHGCGPVHLNLVTTYSFNEETALTAKELPDTRVIRRITRDDK